MTTKYNELVDYQVSQMKTNERKSFDQLYEEFSSKSVEEQVTNLKELGRKLVSQLDGIVDKLNDIIEGDITEEDDENEFEITVDPLTHKVLYNTELKQYKVVKRYD